MNRSSRQKTNKGTLYLHFRPDVPNRHRTCHLTAAVYTFFSKTHEDPPGQMMLNHKTILNKFRKIEIIPSIFSNHNDMTLEFNFIKKTEKITNMWRLNNLLLNNYCVRKEVKGEIKEYIKTNKNGDAVKAV